MHFVPILSVFHSDVIQCDFEIEIRTMLNKWDQLKTKGLQVSADRFKILKAEQKSQQC